MSAFLLVQVSGCSGSPGGKLKAYDPPTAAAKAIELYDANGDGKLAADELTKSPALAVSARRLDSNRDSMLTADEIQARFEEAAKWPKLIGLDTWVSARGRPLVGAELTLTPEPFMGDNYPVFKGSTVEGGGYVSPTDERELIGVPAGFYTLRVVHPGQRIDIVRGIEIASDTTGSRLEIAL